MADYIRFRWASAKVGASMALLALIAGIAEKAGAAPTARPADSVGSVLKLAGLGSTIKQDFLKLESKLLSVNKSLLKYEKSVAAHVYDKASVNKAFLKVKAANAEFLKSSDASLKYLKITDATAKFLKITDATAKFLPISSTAANASKLGGLTPDAFVQGRANVASGAISLAAGDTNPKTILQSAGGIIVVAAERVVGGGTTLVITNNSNGILPAVQVTDENDNGSQQPTNTVPQNLAHGANTIALGASIGEIYQVHIQIFPNAAAGVNQVMTLTLSAEPDPATPGNTAIVAQLIVGSI